MKLENMLKQESEGFDTGSILRIGSLVPIDTGEAECLDTCAAGCLEKTVLVSSVSLVI